MNKKMWAGRFSAQTDSRTDGFNSSLPFDCRLYKYDIRGSIAHSRMLADCGTISEDDCNAIRSGLLAVQKDIESGALAFDDSEDIHMFVEAELTKRIGDAGKRLHTARSRNDQVALDMRLYLKDCIKSLKAQIISLIRALTDTAEKNVNTIIPGFTHMQKAQPVTLAFYLNAYSEMLLRDLDNFSSAYKHTDIMPLGSGALAGVAYPIDRELTAKLLDFKSVSRNAMDSVSDRDFCAEFCFAVSMLMMHLSRLNEEIIYWASDDYKYLTLDDRFATGSSIMPNKKNPDISELIRGKTGRAYGNLTTLLTMLKGLPLAYNKDMQEDKEAVFDSFDTASACLDIFTEMFRTITFNRDRLHKAAGSGYTQATDIADYLVRKKGLPFRDAHHVSGSLVAYCISKNKTFDKLTLAEYKNFSPLFDETIMDTVKLSNIVKARNSTGGTAPSAVRKSLAGIKKALAAHEKNN